MYRYLVPKSIIDVKASTTPSTNFAELVYKHDVLEFEFEVKPNVPVDL